MRVERPAGSGNDTQTAKAFHPGAELPIIFNSETAVSVVVLRYRHINQAERWKAVPMRRSGRSYQVPIPADYTNARFPLQYYFVPRIDKAAWFYPAFNATLSNQPYFDAYERS